MKTRLTIYGLAFMSLVSIALAIQTSGSDRAVGPAASSAAEGLRSTLAKLQKQTGLTLAFVNRNVKMVDFSDRSLREYSLSPPRTSGLLSLDGTKIAFGIYGNSSGPTFGVSQLDGTDLQEFVTDSPNIICWSGDKTTLALSTSRPDTVRILDMKTKITQAVATDSRLTEQCWSPDLKKLVYETEGKIIVLDLEKKTTELLAEGTDATWSPDGSWIAFREKNSYYAVRPSTREEKLLFKSKGTLSGLCWSPDSQIVAYLSRTSFSEGSWRSLDIELVRLRVRRLSDNSEDWVSDLSEAYLPRYQWVQNAELFHNAGHTP